MLVLFSEHSLKLWHLPQQYLLHQDCTNSLKNAKKFSNIPKDWMHVHLVQQEKFCNFWFYVLLPISGSPTCQERPKCSALLMEKEQRPGIDHFRFNQQATAIHVLGHIWKTPPYLSEGLPFSWPCFTSEKSFPQNAGADTFLRIMKHSPSTVVLHPPLYHFLYLLFLFFLSSFLTFSHPLCLTQVCLLLQFLLIKNLGQYLHLMTSGMLQGSRAMGQPVSCPLGCCWEAKQWW